MTKTAYSGPWLALHPSLRADDGGDVETKIHHDPDPAGPPRAAQDTGRYWRQAD